MKNLKNRDKFLFEQNNDPFNEEREDENDVTQDDVAWVSADWKDTEELIDGFREALEKFGLHMYEDPDFDDTDSYGFIISKTELSDNQIEALSRAHNQDFFED